LVNVALTLLSSAGAWALAGIDAAVTCAGSDDDAAAPARQPTRDVEFLRPID
jgi:hypothetical protein